MTRILFENNIGENLLNRRISASNFSLRERFVVMDILQYIEETNPLEVRQLLIAAHHFLQESLPPFATCAIKWRIPFYKLHRKFCYLNRHRDHITLGFPNGYKLSARPDILLGESEKLKQIRYLEIRSLEDLYSDITQEILHEAIILDETLAKNKPKKRRMTFQSNASFF